MKRNRGQTLAYVGTKRKRKIRDASANVLPRSSFLGDAADKFIHVRTKSFDINLRKVREQTEKPIWLHAKPNKKYFTAQTL